ncbi:probable dolichyl pyrophosphate Glc1Man9GlcNAc2 alpha-1,3-glucosyltransferase [Selaginella moellendorffii]|uniref:probable dolichyl pyrophosphate Glc1Man9GlcNAc2 alpha-1,3-glucosyltransferase n=1 Tax=Selaginella moellendorffii TaxID=88036 RepID=UPI000D1C7D50|nr:probable dolichyl pyrophosphate Glc1Man9GlcNAc2 alpha-1,3-glucosyltransferase [Selaginella moellendorffii]|eukprot:XP_024544555.1 probable dolichyl pyrophosphate Glc1Man9GlcNAc2 alpha-1,3-glucosyltransferase [Selaginella moellendorffii]
MGELLVMAAIATCVKILLVPSYHSTDFEVHRNWLAITHSLPVDRWYVDETSEWTLDYPPFFAWFERLLSAFAAVWDPRIVDLSAGKNYASSSCVLFQRGSVMVADSVLYLGLWSYCKGMAPDKRKLVYAVVVFSPGLLIVDHIHFQYNGFLLGILLLSLAALKQGKDLLGGVIFAALVCFKHLFAVAGPVYFVYLLRHYCSGQRRLRNFFQLAISVLGVVVFAFGPFAYYGQIQQVLRRLFPFGRGLCHAYWAPNIWAMYNTADKALSILFKAAGFKVNSTTAAYTGGLVGEFSSYAVLPSITPLITFAMVLSSLVPWLYKIWRNPQPSRVVYYITYAYMCGFMFGWHVHEKASLHFVVPFSLIAVESMDNANDYLFLSTVCYYSLFPLLYEAREYPIKVLVLLLYSTLLWDCFSNYFSVKVDGKGEDKSKASRHSRTALGRLKSSYLAGMILIEIYGQFGHRFLFPQRLEFLPLMLVSAYCSIGVFYIWVQWFRSGFSIHDWSTLPPPKDKKFGV